MHCNYETAYKYSDNYHNSIYITESLLFHDEIYISVSLLVPPYMPLFLTAVP